MTPEARTLLSQSAWFKSLPASLQDAILEKGEIRQFARGETIQVEASQARGLIGVLEGRALVTRRSVRGDAVPLYVAGPGFWFGEYAVLSDVTAVSAVAQTSLRALVLSKAGFDSIVAKTPEHFREFVSLLVVRYGTLLRFLVETLALSPDARLRIRLAELAEIRSHETAVPGPEVVLDVSQSELGQMIGVSRQKLNELLGKLRQEGFVDIRQRRIQVRSPGALRASVAAAVVSGRVGPGAAVQRPPSQVELRTPPPATGISGTQVLKQEIEQLLHVALTHLKGSLFPADTDLSNLGIERTRDAANGDFATNVALRLAKAARRPPRELAQAIVAALPPSPGVQRVEVAGAGFINFFLAGDGAGRRRAAHPRAGRRLRPQRQRRQPPRAGRVRVVQPDRPAARRPRPARRVRRERREPARGQRLCSASRVLHQRCRPADGHPRGQRLAALPRGLRRALRLPGQRLPRRVRPRDRRRPAAEGGYAARRPEGELFGNLPPDEPEGGDKDAYIDALIARAKQLIGEAGFREALDLGLAAILADIEQDLGEFGVHYDRWYSERSLDETGAIERALERLRRQGHVYEKDGALWFRATGFGDEKDRVVVRENGVKTYFASDIAYHLEKRERGFDLLLDILGSDHHGYVARVRAGLEAMGEPPESLEALLVQFVTLFRGGEKAPMSTRSGEFITLRQLREEVGNDACRFFYVMRGNDQHLDFDLELAKSRTNDNPVYYIQYAHARVASVLRQLAAKGFAYDEHDGLANLALLATPHETALLTALDRYPEIIAQSGANRAPHTLVHYLRDLANAFHTWYNAEQFIVDDGQLRNARLALALATQQVVRSGLHLLGVSAPESM